MRTYLTNEMKFEVCSSDGCILMKPNIVIGLYVDDVIIVGVQNAIDEFILEFGKKFKSRVSKVVDEFIGCELQWDNLNSNVKLHQTPMIEKLERKIGKYIVDYGISCKDTPMKKGENVSSVREDDEIMDGNHQSLYRSCVGNLLYITKHSRPVLSNSVRELSKVNKLGSVKNFKCMLTVCCFLFKTRSIGVILRKNVMLNEWKLEGFSDSDWANDPDTRKIVTGYVVFVSGNPLSWVSRSQKTITLATAHAEYNAISELCKEILYVKYIMDFLNVNPVLPVVIHCDNSGAIFLRKNHETKLSKHLDIKVHFIEKMMADIETYLWHWVIGRYKV